MAKISLQDLSSVLVERRHIGKKEASQFVNEMFYLIQKNLNEEKIVKVKGLGTFKIIDVEDRESVDVNTGDRVLIEGHGKITFTPDALMKELVNKPFSQFETVVLKDGVDFEEELEPEPEPESEPEIVSEPVAEPEPEPILKSVIESDDTYENPSAAPLVEFVTDTTDEEEVSDEPEVIAPVVESAKETQIEEAPAEEKPAEEKPAEEAPAVPTEETPAEEKPAEEASDKDTPAEEVPTEDTPADEEISEDVYEEEENPRPWKWILMVLAACIVGFVAGYLVGRNVETKAWTPDETYQKTEKPATDSLKQKPAVKQEESLAAEPAVEAQQPAKDSVQAATEAPKPETEAAKPAAEPAKPVAEPAKSAAEPAKSAAEPAKPAAEKTEAPVALDKYEQMDSRVRTGAYRIVGTDHMEKVKPGDNLTRISNRTLGKGMECYLEVYNGLKSDVQLKGGQEIKIPKLELKKKRLK
jgi:nucleoid DNA-binding protein